jgi:dTDP-4-amino-4,6-dideoxygalactose transaminase
MPVHIGGLACDMEPIWQIAREHELFVIEDAAHAVGTHYKGLPIGDDRHRTTRSDAVCFSFYATKNLSTGEGGMVVTPNEKLFERMKVLCLHGISKDAWDRYKDKGNWYYEVEECGFKYNLSDIASCLGLHQLRKQETFIQRRADIARFYNEAFRDLPEIEIPPDHPENRHAWHLYAIRLNLERLEINRDEFIRELRLREIGCSVHFIPIPLHPAYRDFSHLPQNRTPRALALYPRLISLPLYPTMTESQLKQVAEAVKQISLAHRAHRVTESTR